MRKDLIAAFNLGHRIGLKDPPAKKVKQDFSFEASRRVWSSEGFRRLK